LLYFFSCFMASWSFSIFFIFLSVYQSFLKEQTEKREIIILQA
jgi:hypothetical protein